MSHTHLPLLVHPKLNTRRADDKNFSFPKFLFIASHNTRTSLKETRTLVTRIRSGKFF